MANVIYRNTVNRPKTGKPQFTYTHAKSGKRISELKRRDIEKVYIPYTWDEVEIYIGHPKMIATGMLKGQLRYMYQKDFINKQSAKKYQRLYQFGLKLPHIKKDIAHRMAGPNNREKIIATALWFLTMCPVRVGNEKYLKENNTHGLLTLHKRHIKLTSNKVCLDFIGKKKVQNYYELCIPNKGYARWLNELHLRARPYYFEFEGRKIDANDLNEYIQTEYGPFTAKDFRTWAANIEFIAVIRKVTTADLTSKKECNSSLKHCIESVADKLNNTVAVCKSNYICKSIIDEYQNDPQRLANFVRKSKSNEQALMVLLKNLG